MPHYLIELSVPSAKAERLFEDPLAWLDAVREAASSVGGRLEGCWFSVDGEGMVAMLHTQQAERIGALRDVFGQICRGIDVDIRRLLTARELEDRSIGDLAALREEMWRDPVDLGSDLSFPASDPPSWWRREAVPSAE